MRPQAILFDFDGVLVDSEFEGNRLLAELLTELGFPTSLHDTYDHYVGLAGRAFLDAVELRIGQPLPAQFIERRRAQGAALLASGVPAVAGAIEFVRSLPPDLPIAIVSSSSTRWQRGHLANHGLDGHFGLHLYSGHEHVERSKPAPDIYLFAARQLDVSIARCVVIEDSPIGIRGAVASGARVIGFAGGAHCRTGHADMLRAAGADLVVRDFVELRRLLSL